jgi:hypothetical protein
MTDKENHELNKKILSELIAIAKDESEPDYFREEIKRELLEIKNEIESIIIEFS